MMKFYEKIKNARSNVLVDGITFIQHEGFFTGS
jgi:hypothetical protein